MVGVNCPLTKGVRQRGESLSTDQRVGPGQVFPEMRARGLAHGIIGVPHRLRVNPCAARGCVLQPVSRSVSLAHKVGALTAALSGELMVRCHGMGGQAVAPRLLSGSMRPAWQKIGEFVVGGRAVLESPQRANDSQLLLADTRNLDKALVPSHHGDKVKKLDPS